MTTHCSDEELQLIAGGQQLPDMVRMQHIASCTSCQEQIAAYKLILSCIHQQPAVAFDFDLAELVSQQLQPVKTKKTSKAFWPAIIAFFTAGSLYLFKNNFLLFVTGISATFLLLSIAICIGIIAFKAHKMYQSYERKIEKLDLSE